MTDAYAAIRRSMFWGPEAWDNTPAPGNRGITSYHPLAGPLCTQVMSNCLRRLEEKEEEIVEKDVCDVTDRKLPQPRTPRPKKKDEKPMKKKNPRFTFLAKMLEAKRQSEDQECPTEYMNEMVADFFELPAPMIEHFLIGDEDSQDDDSTKEGGPTWRFCKAVKDYKRKREETDASWFHQEEFRDEYIDFKNSMKDRRLEYEEQLMSHCEPTPLWMTLREQALKNISSAHQMYRMSRQLELAYEKQSEQNHWNRVYVENLEKDMKELQTHYESKMKKMRTEHVKTQCQLYQQINDLEKSNLEKEEEEDEEKTQVYIPPPSSSSSDGEDDEEDVPLGKQQSPPFPKVIIRTVHLKPGQLLSDVCDVPRPPGWKPPVASNF